MGDCLAMPKLILGQLRWLDTLVKGKVRTKYDSDWTLL